MERYRSNNEIWKYEKSRLARGVGQFVCHFSLENWKFLGEGLNLQLFLLNWNEVAGMGQKKQLIDKKKNNS